MSDDEKDCKGARADAKVQGIADMMENGQTKFMRGLMIREAINPKSRWWASSKLGKAVGGEDCDEPENETSEPTSDISLDKAVAVQPLSPEAGP